MVGPHAVLVSSSHQFKKVNGPMSSLDHIMQPLTIQDDVWIGANVFIKGGITIGRGVVIGAGSVVLKDIPDNKIVGGAAGASTRIIGDRSERSSIIEG
jgi:acetyltransferase-like isoleucine patch superfamily enzyme